MIDGSREHVEQHPEVDVTNLRVLRMQLQLHVLLVSSTTQRVIRRSDDRRSTTMRTQEESSLSRQVQYHT